MDIGTLIGHLEMKATKTHSNESIENGRSEHVENDLSFTYTLIPFPKPLFMGGFLYFLTSDQSCRSEQFMFPTVYIA